MKSANEIKTRGLFLQNSQPLLWFSQLMWLLVVFLVPTEQFTHYQNQRFAMEPQDQTAIVGSRVTLPCRVVNKQGVLQWTKDDFGLGTSRDLPGFERYSMIGSDEEGDYSLDIYPIMLDDDARYQCQVSPGPEGQPAARSTFAKLTVLVPPESPKILQGDIIYSTEGRQMELTCISVGGKPPAEISWRDGLGNVIQDDITYSTLPLADLRRITAKSVLKLTPKREYHNTNFTCQAQNTADRNYRTAKVRLEVKYAPSVRVRICSGADTDGRISEHNQVRLECKADANPSDVQYQWYINDEPIVGGQKTEMFIRNVSRNFHNAIVKCSARNSMGKSEDSETLDISYAPVFKKVPHSLEADSGSSVTLTCEVDGNPTPDIVWIQHPAGRVVGSSSNLTIEVSNATTGRYYCKANVPGYAEISSDAYIYLKGPPKIASAAIQYGLIGDTARIECFASSVPRARHVSWTFNGHEISSKSGHDYSILIDPIPGGVKSTLIIRDSQTYHYGRYNCTVVNDYGNDVIEINLQAQKNISILMIIVSSISAVAILMIFITLIIVYLRCSKRNKLPTADVISEHQIMKNGGITSKVEAGDRSSNYSDLKVDITGGYIPYGDYATNYSPPPQYLNTCPSKLYSCATVANATTSYQKHMQHQQQQQLQQQQQQQKHSRSQQALQQQSLSMTYLTKNPTNGIPGVHNICQDNGLPNMESSTIQAGGIENPDKPQHIPNSNLSSKSSISTPSQAATTAIDPRYSAIYGNPYLKSSNSSLLPPPTAV